MPLPTIDDAPWGVAVKKGEPAFAALMSGMVVNWHLSGRIIELEKKYGLQPTPFAQKMHEMLLGVNPSIERSFYPSPPAARVGEGQTPTVARQRGGEGKRVAEGVDP